MRLAIVGATGLVGEVILKVLEERKFFITKLFLVASKKSKNKKIRFRQKVHNLITIKELLNEKIDLALFSAGSRVSQEWAPQLAKRGVKVIDNSSFWRMNPKKKLIVPEINGHVLTKEDMIIANPNCSTIQLLMPIAPLHHKFKVNRIIVSTYQAVSGTGALAVQQLKNEEQQIKKEMAYPHFIYQNVLPHCDEFNDNGYTKEEMKLSLETNKILDTNIGVTATAVRVPVIRGHSESVNITFSSTFNIEDIYDTLNKAMGVEVLDDVFKNNYPMPINTINKDDVYVGRIRRDFSHEKSINLWIVSDNLRKGAATNTIQIAEYLLKNNIL